MEIHHNALRLELPPPAPVCGGGTDEMQLVGGSFWGLKTRLVAPLNRRKQQGTKAGFGLAPGEAHGPGVDM
jgi:hypothetical protein